MMVQNAGPFPSAPRFILAVCAVREAYGRALGAKIRRRRPYNFSLSDNRFILVARKSSYPLALRSEPNWSRCHMSEPLFRASIWDIHMHESVKKKNLVRDARQKVASWTRSQQCANVRWSRTQRVGRLALAELNYQALEIYFPHFFLSFSHYFPQIFSSFFFFF